MSRRSTKFGFIIQLPFQPHPLPNLIQPPTPTRPLMLPLLSMHLQSTCTGIRTGSFSFTTFQNHGLSIMPSRPSPTYRPTSLFCFWYVHAIIVKMVSSIFPSKMYRSLRPYVSPYIFPCGRAILQMTATPDRSLRTVAWRL
jgi:hypothetical protein